MLVNENASTRDECRPEQDGVGLCFLMDPAIKNWVFLLRSAPMQNEMVTDNSYF